MRRRIHTIILYVLILVVSLPGLLYIYYEAARLHLHFTMEEAMERTHLQVLQIKSDELHWVRDGKEILVGDRMFDVHTFSQSGNSVIITGLFDDQETKIKEQLSFFKNTANQESRSEQKIIQQWSHLHWVCNAYKIYPQPLTAIYKFSYRILDQSLIPSPHLHSILQPPEDSI